MFYIVIVLNKNHKKTQLKLKKKQQFKNFIYHTLSSAMETRHFARLFISLTNISNGIIVCIK